MELLNYNIPVPQTNSLNLIVKNLGLNYVKTLTFTSQPLAGSDADKWVSEATLGTPEGIESVLGKSIWATVALEAEAWEQEYYNEKTRTYDMAKMPPVSLELGTVLVDVQMTKNIITTAINGMNGTVKEYIADGDYEVSLRGALVNAGFDYPRDLVKKFLDLVKAKVSLKVTSEYLGLFPIHNLVVKSYSMPQVEGQCNTQLFEISALSDNPVELIKINL
jgi:Domain of unknown function (DUF6046)